ncbi:MAG TPA: L,D-transpeptidase family protein [Paracoccus sp. (in: a-proteobacteria)]|nr:L,D-transpeptidase family protein [Paracoccus sp. (in: a-proteobacteria)]
MIRRLRGWLALTLLVVLAACGADAPKSRFKTYDGPPVTQVVVKKGERQMFLLSGRQVLKSYKVGLGSQPVGHKLYEGDGRTPEGMYFIDRQNPNSQYHLSLGISYPDPQDTARAMMLGQPAGGDIMIHGRGPYGNRQKAQDWTAGCIAVDDDEIEEIFAMVRPGVPIVIYP